MDRIRHLQPIESHRLGPRRVGAYLTWPHILRSGCKYLEHNLNLFQIDS